MVKKEFDEIVHFNLSNSSSETSPSSDAEIQMSLTNLN